MSEFLGLIKTILFGTMGVLAILVGLLWLWFLLYILPQGIKALLDGRRKK